MTGIDPSQELIGVAKTHAQSLQNVVAPTYLVNTVEQHAEHAHGVYDVIVASEVIEHVSDKESFLAASTCALKVFLRF